MFDHHRNIYGIEIRIAILFNTKGPRMNSDHIHVFSNQLREHKLEVSVMFLTWWMA
ncbi:putative UDP-glucuronate decarboxylase [Dioscorea sansibarensis]